MIELCAAWGEDDSLSDWDAPSSEYHSANDVHEFGNAPETPFQAAVWVANPALMRSTYDMRHRKAYDALKATNLHLQFVSAGVHRCTGDCWAHTQ